MPHPASISFDTHQISHDVIACDYCFGFTCILIREQIYCKGIIKKNSDFWGFLALIYLRGNVALSGSDEAKMSTLLYGFSEIDDWSRTETQLGLKSFKPKAQSAIAV